MLLGDLAEPSRFRNGGIRKYDVELALFLLDPDEEPIEVVELRYVSLDAGDIASDLLDCVRLNHAAPR
jgi:hypothetical protein